MNIASPYFLETSRAQAAQLQEELTASNTNFTVLEKQHSALKKSDQETTATVMALKKEKHHLVERMAVLKTTQQTTNDQYNSKVVHLQEEVMSRGKATASTVSTLVTKNTDLETKVKKLSLAETETVHHMEGNPTFRLIHIFNLSLYSFVFNLSLYSFIFNPTF